MSVIAELKRRNVVRVAVLYGLAAWLILQVADVLVPALGLPGWVMRLVVLLLILGQPPVLIFSWVYELTPEGLKKQLEVDRDQSATHETGRKINYLIGALAALAIVVVAVERFMPRAAPVPAATDEEPGAPPAEKPGQAAARSIAVLPFTNLTGDPGQEIVADGLAEEVANQLAAIPEPRVTGRRSGFSFKDKNEDLRVIANKLDVANLLEGSHEQSGILAALDQIAQDVARALSVTLDVGALNRAQGGTMSLEDALGDRDLALNVLRSDITRYRGRTGTWWWPWMLVHSGARADPRFKELMREAGLADYWRQSGKWADFCGPVGEDDFACH